MRRKRRQSSSYRRSDVQKAPRNTSIADTIKNRVARYYSRKHRVCFFELGLCSGGRLRADVMALAMNGHVIVVEVKSSVADYRSDKKMLLYKEYCNKLYVALPISVYEKVKEDIHLDKDVGVFVMSDDGSVLKKVLPSRNRQIHEDVSYNLAIRAAFRASDTTNRKNR